MRGGPPHDLAHRGGRGRRSERVGGRGPRSAGHGTTHGCGYGADTGRCLERGGTSLGREERLVGLFGSELGGRRASPSRRAGYLRGPVATSTWSAARMSSIEALRSASEMNMASRPRLDEAFLAPAVLSGMESFRP